MSNTTPQQWSSRNTPVVRLHNHRRTGSIVRRVNLYDRAAVATGTVEPDGRRGGYGVEIRRAAAAVSVVNATVGQPVSNGSRKWAPNSAVMDAGARREPTLMAGRRRRQRRGDSGGGTGAQSRPPH